MSAHFDPYQDPRGPEVRLAVPALTPVVKRLILANAAMFLLTFMLWLLPFETNVSGLLIDVLGLNPELWKGLFPFVPFWQVASYGFLHSLGDLLHLFFNMLLLYFFGTMLEGIVGSRRFLVTYFLALFAGAFLHLAIESWKASPPQAIGASGAVLGVLIAVAVLQPETRVLFFFVPVKLKWLAIGLVTLDVFHVLVQLKMGAPGSVAHYVHLGGAAYGFAAARLGWLWWDPVQRVLDRRALAREIRRQSDESRMDALLEKIHREGLQSLSRREKDFLKRMSARR